MKEKFSTSKGLRVVCLMLVDVVMFNIAAFLALLVRFEFSMQLLQNSGYLSSLPLLASLGSVITIVVFYIFRLYNSLWEYAGGEEACRIVVASCASVAAEILVMFFLHNPAPRSYPIILMMFLVAFTLFTRFSYCFIRRSMRKQTAKKIRRRTMIIGAGQAAYMAIREFQTNAGSENEVICLIDDNHAKWGSYISGIPIVGGRDKIADAAVENAIDEILFAIPSASAAVRHDILEICRTTGCDMKILPSLTQLANGEVTIERIRRVEIEDLLGRDMAKVDLTGIGDDIKGKTVLVTGGGGSIGSELCRQLASFSPGYLVIFDIYENNAYDIQQWLKRNYPDLDLYVRIGSVRDKKCVDRLFEEFHPDFVYHAAAHKHVPLMEASPAEAVKNNVFGTLNVVNAAETFGTKRFVMISTDKAVNPTNVMGATKRICEMIICMANKRSSTDFVAVRFGNVLGSNGSVIPLFRKQIEAGGPVTVTDPRIIRYFMTIPEAVSLVLQAGVYAKGGEIFVLDMGEPVKIDDLARNMIRLSGFEPDKDIKIEYTGLRPGEKLYEELMMDEEGMKKTENSLIYIGREIEFDEEEFLTNLKELKQAAESGTGNLRELIHRIVPTYIMPEKVEK